MSDFTGFEFNEADLSKDGVRRTGQRGAIACFTAGTRILTPQGQRPVEHLVPGDMVMTRDHGLQTLRWIGCRHVDTNEIADFDQVRPVRIRKGALGNQMPDRDLLVSGDHRVMVSGPGFEELLLDADEVLVPAKLLLGRDGVSVDEADAVIYYHLMFDETELLLSEGIWTESTQPVTGSLAGPDAEAIDELHRLFPELKLAAAAPKISRLTLDPVLAGMFGFTGATLLTTRPA